jgi:PAS domain-containing protein
MAMPRRVIQATAPIDLRAQAALRLGGPAGSAGAASRATDALAVLHALASSPATAGDALALLHELQVHQVELDLQAEELRDSRAELEEGLRRQTELYDFQPVGCLSVDAALIIREANRKGAAMLGVEQDAACGLHLDGFFTPDSVRTLHGLLAGVHEGGATSAVLRRRGGAATPRALRIDVGPDPSGAGFLLALMGVED